MIAFLRFLKKHIRVAAFVIFITAIPVYASGIQQEARVNRRKIEKERARKEKANEKKYHDAVKQHQKNQSKETRNMMKQTQKESRKHTPATPKKGKCR